VQNQVSPAGSPDGPQRDGKTTTHRGAKSIWGYAPACLGEMPLALVAWCGWPAVLQKRAKLGIGLVGVARGTKKNQKVAVPNRGHRYGK